MNDLFHPRRLPSPMIEVDSGVPFRWKPNSDIDGFDLELEGGNLSYSEQFFSPNISDRMFEYLQENSWKDWREVDWASLPPEKLHKVGFTNIAWKQDHIKLFGKKVPLPRLTSWYGDPGASYEYSGIKSDPNPWNKGLIYLKDFLEARTRARFNSVLLNWYRDGSDSLNWHADDEMELGDQPIIASASFGEARDFLFKPKGDKKTRVKLKLTHGSLVIMSGRTQENWVHSIPKRKSIVGSRFNLTFRHIS